MRACATNLNAEVFYTLREAQIIIEIARIQTTSSGRVRASLRRVAGCATPTGSAGRAADPHVLHGGRSRTAARNIVDFLPRSVGHGLRGEPAAFRQRLEADEQRGLVYRGGRAEREPTLATAGSARVSTSAYLLQLVHGLERHLGRSLESWCRSSAISDRLSSEKRKRHDPEGRNERAAMRRRQ